MRDDGRPVRGLIVAAALLGALGCGDAPAPGPALQITTDTVKLRRGDPLPATSAIFDGETVRLRGARGDVLGVMVWRRGGGRVPARLAIAGAEVAAYRVDHHAVTRPSTSMYGPSAGAGDWPDRLVATAALEVERAGYFEVRIPDSLAAGGHAGALTVGDATFSVALEVADVTLPSMEARPRVWAYLDPREIERAGGSPVGWAMGLRRFGVAASPDLGLDAYDTWRAPLAGLGYVPALLPDEPAAEAAAIRGWIERTKGTGALPFAVPIDEPRRLWQKATVRERAARARVAGAGPSTFLYMVTDAPHFLYGDLIDVYCSPFAPRVGAPRPVAGATPRYWTYNGTPPFAGAMILDTDGAAMRTWGWIGWRWRIELWYVWDAAYWSDRHNHRRKTGVRGLAPPGSLDRDPVTFDDGDDRGNLDGVLAYPDGAPSLRLAQLRRGLLDRALLEEVERCAGRAAADAIAADLVPLALGDAGGPGTRGAGAWPRDEAAWEAARGRLLDLAAACSR